MANLTVREHIASDLLDLKQDFERVFHHIFKHLIDTGPRYQTGALNIILQGNRLTFSGERKKEDKTAKNYIDREFSYDRFARTVRLPDGVDGEKTTSEMKDGILAITAPIAAAAIPKKISLKKVATTQKGEI